MPLFLRERVAVEERPVGENDQIKMEMTTSTIDQIQIMPDFNQVVNKHWSAFPKVKGSSPEEFQEKTLSAFKVS